MWIGEQLRMDETSIHSEVIQWYHSYNIEANRVKYKWKIMWKSWKDWQTEVPFFNKLLFSFQCSFNYSVYHATYMGIYLHGVYVIRYLGLDYHSYISISLQSTSTCCISHTFCRLFLTFNKQLFPACDVWLTCALKWRKQSGHAPTPGGGLHKLTTNCYWFWLCMSSTK